MTGRKTGRTDSGEASFLIPTSFNICNAFRFWSIERGVSVFTIGMQKLNNVWDFEMNELLSWNVIMERHELKAYKICELF